MVETQEQPPAETVAEVVQRFVDGTIDEANWTHAAHLFVCRHLIETQPDPTAAFTEMRRLIKIHNARVEPQGSHGAYHETVTRYFVDAVVDAARHADGGRLTDAALLTAPACRRDAPRRHWTEETLRSTAARAGWVEPDLEPLPWTATTA